MAANNADKPATPSPRGALPSIWLTVFIDLAGFSIIFPLFPAMLQWYLPREGSESLLGHLIDWLRVITPATGNREFLVAVLFGGILGSVYSLLQFVAAPYWGRLSDRIGRRQVLLITVAGTALSYALWAFTASFALLIAARVLGGIMAGNLSVATAAIADHTDRANRSKGMALIGVAFGLGFICGPALGGLSTLWYFNASATTWGFNPFSGAALIALALAVINWFWVWRAFPESKPATAKGTPKPTERHGWMIFRSRIAAVRKAIRVYFIFILAFAGMEFTLTFLAFERLMYGPGEMTKIFLYIGFVLILVQGVLVRRLAPRLGELFLIRSGLLAGFLGLVMLAAAPSSLLFYSGLTFMAIGIGCGTPALTGLVSLYSPEEAQGRELGVFRSSGSLARAIGPIAAAILFWGAGSNNAYLAGAGIVLCSFLMALFLPQPQKEE